MIVKLTSEISAVVVFGTKLPFLPRWWLRGSSIKIGPYPLPSQYEKHIGSTVGSMDWLSTESDEIRFGSEDLLLQSIHVHTHETNLPAEKSLSEWTNLQPVIGSLRLEKATEFYVKPADFRWMGADGKMLAGITAEALADNTEKLRLGIAVDFDLLFSNGLMCGWLLSNPGRYLVQGTEDVHTTEPEGKLNKLLYEYITLVSIPNIIQMENEDPEPLRRLQDLHIRIKDELGTSEQSRVLQAATEDIADQFYSTELQ